MMAHLDHQDMSLTALEMNSMEELKETANRNLEENGIMCLSNGMDIGQENLLLHGKLHKDTNVIEELSQSMEGIAIEKTNKTVVDTDQFNECSERCMKPLIDSIAVTGSNNGSATMQGENASMLENKEEVYSTKPSKVTTLEVLKGQKPAPPMASVKCTSQSVTQRKHALETEQVKPLTRVLNSKNTINNLSPNLSSTTRTSSAKFTKARPFTLATDRRAEERPATNVSNSPSDFPQDVKMLCQKFFVAKSNHSDNIKHPVSQDRVQTIATGFNFRSDERAKKRKEFYSKLQEKFNAKEQEKTQMQAKTEKEDEEALKVLRRSLTFKASPMPNFYQEDPPPKVEPKKIPTTQAKSPKFSSRSRRGASKSVSDGICKAEDGYSDGLRQHSETDIVDALHQSKECLRKRLVKCSLLDAPSGQISNSNPLPLPNNEGANATDEMNKRNFEETCCEGELMSSNRTPDEAAKTRQGVKAGAITKASSERHEKLQGKCGSNVLRNCANKNLAISSSVSNKMKLKVQPLSYDMKEDLSPKTNKTTKKERLKALTPYFRKRDSIGNVRQSTTTLTEKVAIDVEAVGT